MLRTTAEFPQPAAGILEGNVETPTGWSNLGGLDVLHSLVIQFGDEQSGPLVSLISKEAGSIPGLTDDLIEDMSALVHYHRTDTFRIAVGDAPEQIHHAGAWLGRGDFLFMRANKTYTETTGTSAMRFVDVSADRRGQPGHMALDKKHPAFAAQYQGDQAPVPGLDPDQRIPFHATDEDAVSALRTSFAPVPAGGRLFGSMTDDDGWTPLSDGSRIAVLLMGDPTSGPLVLLSNNAPGSIESPGCRFGTDVFRVIVTGDCTIGTTSYGAESFRTVQEGTTEGPVAHGPNGSSQVLIFADRRFCAPELDGPVSAEVEQRMREVAAAITEILETATLETV